MGAAYNAGFNAKIRVGSVGSPTLVLTAHQYNAQERGQGLPVSNFEGTPGNPNAPLNVTRIGTEATIGGLTRMHATITQATFDSNENLFAAPRAIAARTYIALQIFIDGLGGKSWYSPNFYVEEVTSSGTADGLQPQSFRGYSDGDYSTPGA